MGSEEVEERNKERVGIEDIKKLGGKRNVLEDK